MLRMILLILGILIILGIAFDGWRRKRKRLKQTRTIVPPQPESSVDDETTLAQPIVQEIQVEDDEQKTIDLSIEELEDLPQENSYNVLHAEEKFVAEPHNGPSPVEIEPVFTPESSANQVLPKKKPIEPDVVQSANQAMPKQQTAQPTQDEKPIDVISLTVMSINSRPFAGYDVIRALQESHLHHGEYDIYHRYKYRNGKGPLYFSVASIVKPGTINPRKIGELSTPGLAIFMELNNPKHDRTVFKQALATAHELAKTLGGVVCDNKRIPLRESTLQVYADKINL